MCASPIPAPSSPLPEIHEALPGPDSVGASKSFLTTGKLLVWGRKSAYSLIDQGLTALTSFSVSFLLARWLAPDVYGAYAVAFAAYLFVCGFPNALVLEPMSVLGPARHAAVLPRYFRAQIAVHVVLVGILSVAALVASLTAWRLSPQGPLAAALLGAGLAVPFLLLLWLARRMCYVRQRPATAIAGTSVCLLLVLLGLYLLRHLDLLSPFTAFLLLGGASFLGSCVILGRLAAATSTTDSPGALPWQSALRENWSYGRWLVGNAILYPLSGQLQMFLVAGFLGLGSAGVLRAMMLPAAVMTQAVSASDLLILPGFSYDFGRTFLRRMRQKAALVSCALAAAGLCFAVLLHFVTVPTERFLFRGKFASYAWLMPALALIPAANGFNAGFSAALRASQKPHFDLFANAIAAPVAVVTAFVFIHRWGLAGAATSLVAGSVALALVNFFSYCYFARQIPAYPPVRTQSAVLVGKNT
jgi:O-antigen/teichoic acid export membrane protein